VPLLVQFCDAEVAKLRIASTRDVNVRGLDIAMKDANPVDGRERISHLQAPFDDFFEAQSARRQETIEVLAIDQLHRDEPPVSDRADVVDGDDVRVGDRARESCLGFESVERRWIIREGGVQNLQRHLAPESRIFGKPDDAHAAFAEAANDVVVLDRLADHGGLLYVYSSIVQFRFDPFVLDTGTRQLLRGSVAVDLSPKAFDLLTVLLENRPLALGKQDLHARIWPATFVSDTSLSTLVNEIRAALNDDARRPRFVRTVHGYGYAFCGAAEALTGGRSFAVAQSWIRWQGRDVPLTEGVNIIGRDPGSAIRIDLPEISRRHASIVVGLEQATIEDLGSRNGTFVGDEAVTAPRRLRDGDAIRLGTVELAFHVAVTGATTQAMPAHRTQS